MTAFADESSRHWLSALATAKVNDCLTRCSRHLLLVESVDDKRHFFYEVGHFLRNQEEMPSLAMAIADECTAAAGGGIIRPSQRRFLAFHAFVTAWEHAFNIDHEFPLHVQRIAEDFSAFFVRETGHPLSTALDFSTICRSRFMSNHGGTHGIDR